MSQRTTISKKKFFFLQKQLNKAFQKLANNKYHCKQYKTNLPSHITKQDHRTEREVDKDSSILNLRNKPNQEAYPNTKSSSRKLPDKADTTQHFQQSSIFRTQGIFKILSKHLLRNVL